MEVLWAKNRKAILQKKTREKYDLTLWDYFVCVCPDNLFVGRRINTIIYK